ncbi:uncharacterized protein LOC131549599 [Onychostoma macrolepis]|uniref:AXH domain-containing protein n=1 Tax=Onychostoma macrolepis TaxID=369639 RepID=A0A7J6CIX2_9TELE|nr:uncharacterized protein LOC131549599 [Onychostoma macrolepis]KAF4107094.1 hypothetical protein G5714_011458 [Onychostoma macrolepis]
MAKNTSSSSVFEKWDSVPNEQPSEPIFKIPSPFWNQDLIYRRSRQVRESTPDVVTDGFNMYTYRCDLGPVTSPDLSCVIGANQIHPSPSLNSTSSRYLSPSSKLLVSDPNALHSIGRGTSYWSYLTPEVGHGLVKGFRKLHNPQIDPLPASYFYRGFVRDTLRRDIPNEEVKMCMQKERPRYSHWYHEPQSQRICSKRDRGRHYEKNNPLLGSLLHTDYNKEYFKHNIKYNHHQPLNLNDSTHAVPEESQRESETQTRKELPLLVWRGEAEKHNLQTNTSSQSKSSSSALWVLRRFAEGTLVELEGGRLKRVEDLKMEDMEQCAQLHPGLMLKRFTVLKMIPSHTPTLSCLCVEIEHDHSELSLEVSEGLPFFVCGHGWSSCNPQHTSQTCRLQCRQLKVGDMCLALTHMAASSSQPANQSLAEVSGDPPAPKCHAENNPTLQKKHQSRKRHFTAPELREISKVHNIEN